MVAPILEELSDASIHVPDPMADILAQRQPNARLEAFFTELVSEMAEDLLA